MTAMRTGMMRIVCGLLAVSVLPAGLAQHDESQGAAGGEARGTGRRPTPEVVEVVPLAHVAAREVSDQVVRIVPDLRTAVDERMNALILSGPSAAVEAAKELLGRLDTPVDVAHQPQTEMIKLPHSVDATLLNATSRLVARGSSVIAYSDVLVVKGTAEDVEQVRAFLSRVAERSEEPEAAEAHQFQLTFYLLRATTADSAQGTAPRVPKELIPVARGLEESGFADVELVAPLVVNVKQGEVDSNRRDQSRFMVSGDTRRFGPIEIGGVVLGADDGSVDLAVSSEMGFRQRGRMQQAGHFTARTHNVETTVRVPVGDFVVLAATPVEVVEVVPTEGGGAGAGTSGTTASREGTVDASDGPQEVIALAIRATRIGE